jgi:hypothetical protein
MAFRRNREWAGAVVVGMERRMVRVEIMELVAVVTEVEICSLLLLRHLERNLVSSLRLESDGKTSDASLCSLLVRACRVAVMAAKRSRPSWIHCSLREPPHI